MVIVRRILSRGMINRRVVISWWTYYYITILRICTNTMTRIEGEHVGRTNTITNTMTGLEGENVGIMIMFNIIYRQYIPTVL